MPFTPGSQHHEPLYNKVLTWRETVMDHPAASTPCAFKPAESTANHIPSTSSVNHSSPPPWSSVLRSPSPPLECMACVGEGPEDAESTSSSDSFPTTLEDMVEVMHQVVESEEKWYNERNEAELQYDDVRAKVLHTRRMLHLAHRKVYRVETAARERGLSLTFSAICRQRRHHDPKAAASHCSQ